MTSSATFEDMQRKSAAADTNTAPRRWSRKVAVDCVTFLDIIAVTAGSMVPAMVYQSFGGMQADWSLIIQSSIAASVVFVLCMKSWGMYDPRQTHDFPQFPGRIVAALGFALFLVVGLGLPKAIQNAHLWIWYAVWASGSFTLLLANRMIAHAVLGRLTASGVFNQRVAVFGAGPIARRVHDFLIDPSLKIKFVGVFDDRVGEDRLNPEGLDVAGKLQDLIDASRREEIDQIVVALPQQADGRIQFIVKKLEQLPVSVHIVTHISSDLVENRMSHHDVSNIGSVGLLDVKKKPLADWGPLVKRAEDVVFGWVFFLLTLPLYPIIALAIKSTSAGPVLFRQTRRGLNHRDIEVLKFRTMSVMENGNTVEQATRGDPRVTAVGGFLRRFSLDELPQLWNVIRGEMSLVGPRPHALVHDEKFGQMLEEYANRHQVKPGLTGLAQVGGFRGETDTTAKMEGRVSLDIEYIKNWSFWLDMKILVQTIWVVIRGNNAH